MTWTLCASVASSPRRLRARTLRCPPVAARGRGRRRRRSSTRRAAVRGWGGWRRALVHDLAEGALGIGGVAPRRDDVLHHHRRAARTARRRVHDGVAAFAELRADGEVPPHVGDAPPALDTSFVLPAAGSGGIASSPTPPPGSAAASGGSGAGGALNCARDPRRRAARHRRQAEIVIRRVGRRRCRVGRSCRRRVGANRLRRNARLQLRRRQKLPLHKCAVEARAVVAPPAALGTGAASADHRRRICCASARSTLCRGPAMTAAWKASLRGGLGCCSRLTSAPRSDGGRCCGALCSHENDADRCRSRLLLALGAAAAHGISLGKWTNTQYASEQGARPPHSPSSVSATLSHHHPPRAVGLPCPLLPDFKPQVVGWAGHHEWNSRITFARWQPGAKLWLDFGVNGRSSRSTRTRRW